MHTFLHLLHDVSYYFYANIQIPCNMTTVKKFIVVSDGPKLRIILKLCKRVKRKCKNCGKLSGFILIFSLGLCSQKIVEI